MAMRIIAGTHRGRRILPPKDTHTTRPITDRVKQSLFDRLWSMGVLPHGPDEPGGDPGESGGDPADLPGDFPGEPIRAIDIFCGTGSLGLEALSRGVDHCTFVDMDREAIACLERNLTDLDFKDRARVIKASALSPIWLGQLKPGSIHLICLDPPYAMAEDEKGSRDLMKLMEALSKVAAEGCVLSYRTSKHLTPPPTKGWLGPTSHNYGSMTLHFYEKATE